MKFFTKIIFLLLSFLNSFGVWAVAVEDVENVHVQNRTRYVTDMAGMLSPTTVTRLDSIMADIWHQSSAEPVIVIVDNLDGMDVDDYATRLFDLWKPGKKDKDNGVILLVSRDDRKFVIRTGYGVEGLLPDALCWKILNNEMKPQFRQGDYDAGVLNAATAMQSVLTSDEARAELMSKYSSDEKQSDDGPNLFVTYLRLAILLLIGFLIYYFYLVFKARRMSSPQAYHLFEGKKLMILVLTVATLGIMLPVLILWLWRMKYIRNHPHICSNCGSKMTKLDEETDNNYLTPAQDAEERLNSVDYDVWLCPTCNQTEIIPFINPQKNYKICPICGARTSTLVSDRITRQPTTVTKGEGLRTYQCFNCNHSSRIPYEIPKLAPAVPIIIGGGGRGFGGGGGFSGGSFGGGMTGGGGASGGW